MGWDATGLMDPCMALATLMDRARNAEREANKLRKEKEKLKEKLRRIRMRLRDLVDLVGGDWADDDSDGSDDTV